MTEEQQLGHVNPDELAQWVSKAQDGDRAAFESLYQATWRLAYKIAYSVVGPNLADDAVQESYLQVFRKLKAVKEPEAFRGWLGRLVLHTCYRMGKRDKRTSELQEEEKSQTDPTEVALNSLALRQALGQLKTSDREILILRELLGLSYEEVSYALGLALGTVRSRLHGARKRLAKVLKTVS